MVILICGLPGSGKTTLAKNLINCLREHKTSVSHFNADEVRTIHKDWDFSPEGRIRQCDRMKKLALESKSEIVVCDFVAPTEEIRNRFDADYIIFMGTTNFGRYMDTNKIFEPPEKSDIHIKNFDYNIDEIVRNILCLKKQRRK